MPVTYVVHSLRIVNKKNGLHPKQEVYESFSDPSEAYELACKKISAIIKREGYFTEKPEKAEKAEKAEKVETVEKVEKPLSEYERRQKAVSETMKSDEPWPAKYYDMDDILSKWCPVVPELNCKKYDIRVTDCDHH
jgi:hypothetical protein